MGENTSPEGYDWINDLQWHNEDFLDSVDFSFGPIEHLQARFEKFPDCKGHAGRLAFLVKKEKDFATQNLKPGRKHIHQLAKLGFLLYFGSKQDITSFEFQGQLLLDWVRKNGLPVYTAQFPYHSQITTCNQRVRNGYGSLRMLIDDWPVEYQFEVDNPDYFLMFDTTLRAFAIDAFLLYAEACLIFDTSFRQARNRKKEPFYSTISQDNPLEALLEIGKFLFANAGIDEDVHLSTEDKLPPQFMASYGSKFESWQRRMAQAYADKFAGKENAEIECNPKDAEDYLEHIFAEIENYMYRVHLKLSPQEKFGDEKMNRVKMSVNVPDLLSLCWLELFLFARTEGSKGLRVCAAADCWQGFFTPSRDNQIYCCESCRIRTNTRKSRERHDDKENKSTKRKDK